MRLVNVLKLRSVTLNRVGLTSVCAQEKHFSTHAVAEESIAIPKRIPRGPTDILRALETTITKDPTAAHFKYHDDPYLIPTSNAGKRVFAMAQESGRKAAHWVRQQNTELFQHNEAEPAIEAFIPRMVYTENSDVTEADLKKVIKDVLVSDAILIYGLLKNKGTNVSPETLQSLLELVCFHNGQDSLPDEFTEERWFRQSMKGKDKVRKTWKDGGIAEEIFISIDNPNAEAYSAIIQGMAKYYQVQRAWELFEEARGKGLLLNADAYNAIIRNANFLKESYAMRWEFVIDLLQSMKQSKLKPNLHTLNAVLECLSMMGTHKIVKNYVLSTLSEFKRLGIEPSLGSWYFVLMAFCKDRVEKSFILHDIMAQIENKNHTIRDLKDTSFFVTAMDICRNHLNDIALAKRVHALLNYGNNYNLIGDSYKESVYYRHYFILLSSMENFDDFMNDIYSKFVPHIYIPEPAVMGEILMTVEASGAIEYIPKLWSDMTMFDHTDRESLLDLILNIMINNEPPEDSNLNERFAYIGWDIYNKISNQPDERIQKLSFTGEMLGNIMFLLLKHKDFEKASQIMQKLDKGHQTIAGIPKFEPLAMYVDSCIENKAPSKAIICIQYCVDSGYQEATQLAIKLNKNLTLDDTHLDKLKKIFGDLSMFNNEPVEVKNQ